MLITNDNIQVRAPKPIDDKSGLFEAGAWRPYNSIQEVDTKLIMQYRAISQEVAVIVNGVQVKMWFVGGTTINHLKPLASGSSVFEWLSSDIDGNLDI